jgi:ubiquinone/menaquinone biosynthesis C-methylase UbiE
LDIKLKLSAYLAKQARKPEGFFGRSVMRLIFDYGNSFLNKMVYDLIAVKRNDRIIEIGPGTGKLIYKIAKTIDEGFIEGVDFSSTMVSISRQRNRRWIDKKRVKIVEADFNSMPYQKEQFTKACSVNTVYFWTSPSDTAKKIAEILKPGGKLFLAFEDIKQLQKRKLDNEIFHLYSKEEVRDLLIEAGFSTDIEIISKKNLGFLYNCIIAKK